MKVAILPYSDIDKVRWDHVVNSSSNGRVYNMSWYLDAIMPNKWSGLVVGDYQAVLPLFVKQKFGLSYITQPPLAQRFDFCCASTFNIDDEIEALSSLHRHYPKITLHLSEACDLFLNKAKTNHFLTINKTYQEIAEGYNRNTKRNIKNSKEYALAEFHEIDSISFVQCLQNSDVSEILNPLSTSIHNLLSIKNSESNVKLRGVTLDGKIESVGLSIIHKRRNYFLICGSTPKGKIGTATYFLIDKLIQESIGEADIFDFTGSNIPDIARRNIGFGAETEQYTVATKYLFPILKW